MLALAALPCQFSSAQQSDDPNNLSKKSARERKEPLIALGRFGDKRIVESSGVATARPNADGNAANAIWTCNDSGGDSILYRVNVKGHTEATLRLKEATNRDWETMCGFSIDQKRFLAVGDVGDNSFNRKSCQIYIVEEPVIKPKKAKRQKKARILDLDSKVFTLEFQYADGAHNCEAMSYNAEDDTFWFVEKVYVDDKRTTAPGFYVLPNPMVADASEKKGDRGNRAWLFEKLESKTWLETINEIKPTALSLPLQSQGEAICFSTDSESLLVTSEMKNAIIWQVSLDQKSKKE